MIAREFCEGCLTLFEYETLVETDLVPTDFFGRYSDFNNDKPVILCDSCWNIVMRWGLTELISLKNHFGTVGIGIAQPGKTITFQRPDWYLAAYCGKSLS